MRDVMAAAECARLELDSQIADTLLAERDSAAALLLAEVYCRYFYLLNPLPLPFELCPVYLRYF